MKSVLISIQRPHTDNIKALIKKIEIRKNKPNQGTPFPCYIYETKTKGGCGKVIGEFVCNFIDEINPCYEFYSDGYDIDNDMLVETCLTRTKLYSYGGGKTLYCWHISDLKIYDKPKELNDFCKPCKMTPPMCDDRCEYYSDYSGVCMNYVNRPPQSWCYVEELEEVK